MKISDYISTKVFEGVRFFQPPRLIEKDQEYGRCQKCGAGTFHVCGMVCVDICPRCDRMQ